MARYALHSVKIAATPADIHIPVTRGAADPRIEKIVDGAGSSIDNTVAAVRQSLAEVTFSTPALETAIDACDQTGLDIGSSNVLTLYYAKLVSGGNYSSSADNISITVNEGTMALARCNASKQGRVELEYVVRPTFDGTNDPLTVATNVSLPTVTHLGEVWGLHSASIVYAGPTTLTIPVESVNLDMGVNIESVGNSCGVYNTIAPLLAEAVTAQITTHAVKSVLDALGINGLAPTTTHLYFGKFADGGTFDEDSVHIRASLNAGYLCLDSIPDVQHNAIATAQLMAYPVKAGATAPCTWSTDQALPACSGYDALWTLGPISTGTTLTVQSWGLRMGQQVIHEGEAGSVHHTIAALARRAPVFTAQVQESLAAAYFGAATDVKFYLRKLAGGGGRVADATEVHIQFNLPAAITTGAGVDGSYGAAWQGRVEVAPYYDGTDPVIEIDTTAAIA